MRISRLIALLALASGAAHAFDFKTVTDNAVVYDGGSRQANPQFIVLRGTPVEVIVTVEKWVKIREQSGGIGWVERSQIGNAKNVIVLTTTDVRQQPDNTSPVVFSAAKDLLLESMDQPVGAWIKIKHRDGQTGFVPRRAIWGL